MKLNSSMWPSLLVGWRLRVICFAVFSTREKWHIYTGNEERQTFQREIAGPGNISGQSYSKSAFEDV